MGGHSNPRFHEKMDLRNNKTIRPLDFDKKVRHNHERQQFLQQNDPNVNNSFRDQSLNPLIFEDDHDDLDLSS